MAWTPSRKRRPDSCGSLPGNDRLAPVTDGGGEEGAIWRSVPAEAPSAEAPTSGLERIKPSRPGLSLKGRALKFLSQREHSRLELTRKLGRYCEDPAEIERVLDDLEQARLLSTERFVESLVYRRSARFGSRRIERELDQHGVHDAVRQSALQALRDTEFDRALAVWQARFHEAPGDLKERARQHRFMLQRGFDHETIAKIWRWAASAKL